MKNSYHYTECGLTNIFLANGFKWIKTGRGKAIAIEDVDGLNKVIGHLLVTSKKDLSGDEIRFLRHQLLISQNTLGDLLGVSEQAIRRWENGKIAIPKPSESLLRLLYIEHANDREGKIATLLKKISALEEASYEKKLTFKKASRGWKAAA
jgi:DNA-binding transcriptional regulator YiaG